VSHDSYKAISYGARINPTINSLPLCVQYDMRGQMITVSGVEVHFLRFTTVPLASGRINCIRRNFDSNNAHCAQLHVENVLCFKLYVRTSQ
jgi:hypothetical protein